MTPQQQERWAQLVHMGYQPVMMGGRTNGSVHVAVARKLDAGVLPLLITQDGDLSPEYSVRRPLTTLEANTWHH